MTDDTRGTADESRSGNDRSVDPMRDPTKDPDEWVTGDEPMTGPQRSYLETLAREAREDVPADLTKAEASKRIDELQARTGRGDRTEGRG
jgi:Protein of unknown function (DUF3072)